MNFFVIHFKKNQSLCYRTNFEFQFNLYDEKQTNQTSIGSLLYECELFGGFDRVMILFGRPNEQSELMRSIMNFSLLLF
jgi:hypothetical protein